MIDKKRGRNIPDLAFLFLPTLFLSTCVRFLSVAAELRWVIRCRMIS